MMNLAINGGKKLVERPFKNQCQFDLNKIEGEIEETLSSGVLSHYRGSFQPEFWGGPMIKRLEKTFEEYIGCKQALAVNSCTSALHIACGAIGLQPGDEVIVTPWSMTCSATAPMIYGAIPVFADIEKDYFCLDPEDVKRKITSKTKAIIVVDLFGQPIDIELRKLADSYGVYLIEDAAQALGAHYTVDDKKRMTGTIGHIGCFSFTQGKHITSGEGGMITTNDGELGQKCALIRNHAEAVANGMPEFMQNKMSGMVGFNMRMTEIQAIIAYHELQKFRATIFSTIKKVNEFYAKVENALPYISQPEIRKNTVHTYYVQPFFYNGMSVPRNKYIDAIKAEMMGEENRPGRPMIGAGYITPLYKMPIFQQASHWSIKGMDYTKVFCENCEALQFDKFFLSLYHLLDDDRALDCLFEAFKKIENFIEEI